MWRRRALNLPSRERDRSAPEPDTCFYLEHESQIRDKTEIDLTVGPPPDLAIEVDNTADSEWKLPIFAALGVPEVWRHDVRAGTLWFGKLQEDGTYTPIERSEALPALTRAWVLDALARGMGQSATRWVRQLRVRNFHGHPRCGEEGPAHEHSCRATSCARKSKMNRTKVAQPASGRVGWPLNAATRNFGRRPSCRGGGISANPHPVPRAQAAVPIPRPRLTGGNPPAVDAVALCCCL